MIRNILIVAAFCLCLAWPALVRAAQDKDPLAYPLKQWALVLGLALFGGLASWITKVRKGDVAAHNMQALVGELTIAAFVGVIAFFGCEYLNFDKVLTAAVVGIAGHMGARAITLMEEIAAKRLKDRMGGGAS